MAGFGREFWVEHVRRWKAGGLRQVDYCREAGIAAWSFSHWKRRLEKEDEPSSAPAPFVEARFIAARAVPVGTQESRTGSSGVELLVGQRVVRLTSDFDEAALERLVRLLEAMP